MRTHDLRYRDPSCKRIATDADFAVSNLPLAHAQVIELGCGNGVLALDLLAAAPIAHYTGMEVDAQQHEKNLRKQLDPRVSFRMGAAEDIGLDDASCDIALMMRSLHHVRSDQMGTALAEVARVLRPGGHAWIAEPVYDGPLNALLSLFHDEREVRAEAFDAVRRTVDEGRLELVAQHFYLVERHFEDFADFDRRILQATHTEHRLPASLRAQVQETFAGHMDPDGARFLSPVRVEHLRRAQA